MTFTSLTRQQQPGQTSLLLLEQYRRSGTVMVSLLLGAASTYLVVKMQAVWGAVASGGLGSVHSKRLKLED